jgi:hypothetical protein
MRKTKDCAEKVMRDIRRATRRRDSAEEKIRIVPLRKNYLSTSSLSTNSIQGDYDFSLVAAFSEVAQCFGGFT